VSVTKKYKPGKIREQNSQKILQAAEVEFVKHGYKGTSMQSISDAAGLPKANLHYYFTNKSKLYNAVLQDIVQRWNEVLADITVDDDPAETLEFYIRTKVELAINYPNASKIFATEIIQGAPNLKEYLKTSLRTWLREKTKIIETWVEQGKMSKVDPEHLLFMIWSTTQHYADFEVQILTITNKLEYEADDIERISRFLSHMILTGCGLTPSQKL
jgi:TetR/AcrR family transcriptional regulator